MSSIMRRRRGLISAIWGTSCLRIGLRRPQSCQTGGLPSQPPHLLQLLRKRFSSIRRYREEGGQSIITSRIRREVGPGFLRFELSIAQHADSDAEPEETC